MPKDVYYFSHDSNARRDPKIMAMRNEYGVEGYGRYWMIIETLSEQAGYKLEHKKWTLSGLAMDMQCDIQELEKFIKSLIEDFELLVSDEEYFWSASLMRRMEFKDEKKKRRSEAAKKAAAKRWGNNSNKKPSNDKGSNANAMPKDADASSRNAIHAKGKESKGKESKGKESKLKESISNTNPHTDISDIFSFYENNGFGTLSPKNQEDFIYWVSDLKEIGATTDDAIELVILALSEAVDYNKRSYAYANKCLKDWEQKKFITVDQVKASKSEWQAKNNQDSLPPVEDDNLPW